MELGEIDARLTEIFEKADAQLSNEKYSFISQIDLTEDEFEFLRTNFRHIYANTSSKLDISVNLRTKKYNLLTCIIAVDFGFANYDDTGYWDNFQKYLSYSNGFSNNDRTEFRKLIEQISNHYGLTINYELPGESSQKNINAILVQTFVPDNYLDNFFDYAYSLYDDIRDDQRYKDLFGYFKDLSINFRVPLNQDNSQSSTLGGNKLINATKRVMRDPDAFGPVLEKIFTRIDSNNSWSEDTDLGRFEEKFNIWFKKNQEIVLHSRGQRRRNARFYLSADNALKLMVPSQSIGNKNERGILTVTHSGKTEIVAEAKVISDSNGKKIEEYRFNRDFQFFDRYEVFLNDKNITPSLNMDRYLIFNPYREQIDSPIEGIFYIAVNSGVEIQAEEFKLYTTNGKARIYVVNGKTASPITIGERQFFIGKPLNRLRASIGSSETGIICQNEEHKMPVLPKHPTICFDVGKKTARKTYVELIHSNRIVCTFRLAQAQNDEKNSLKIIDPILGPNVESLPGAYKLRIKIGKEVETYEYFLLPDLRVHFTEPIYRQECNSSVDFGTNLITPKQFNTTEDTVDWDQSFEGINYHFSLAIPSMKYDLGYGEMFENVLTLDDIGDSIEVKCPLFHKPRLVIKFDKEKTYRDSSQAKSFYFDISDLRKEILERKPTKCTLLLSEAGKEEEIVSIDTPTCIKCWGNEERTTFTIFAEHISKGAKISCTVSKNDGDETFAIMAETPYEVDISKSCTVTIKDNSTTSEESILFERKFNFIKIKEDTKVRGDCKSIEKCFLVYVDELKFFVDGPQFECMLNNNLPYSEFDIQQKTEERWEHTGGFPRNNPSIRHMFDKACEAVKEQIIKDELERGNKEALENLARKFYSTKYYPRFFEALQRK